LRDGWGGRVVRARTLAVLAPAGDSSAMEHNFLEGVRLFNSQQYFEAHEALEAVWLKATGDRKTFLHGLIQVAAAFHHHSRNNPAGFKSLLEKGCTKLAPFGAEYEGADLAGLMQQLQRWREHLSASSLPGPPTPPLPHIRLKGNPNRR
jgi:predicted metal-dependent hydrolase